MAIIYTQKYPNRFDAISTSYPQGKFRDRSSDDAHDGSYFQQDWMNDHVGFFGALLKNGGVTPDGTVDTALNSQYYKALLKVIANSLGDYRKKDDLTFKGMVQIHAPDNKGTGVFFIDETGQPTGQVTSTPLGLQFTQRQTSGASQTFTLPKTEGELVIDSQLKTTQKKADDAYNIADSAHSIAVKKWDIQETVGTGAILRTDNYTNAFFDSVSLENKDKMGWYYQILKQPNEILSIYIRDRNQDNKVWGEYYLSSAVNIGRRRILDDRDLENTSKLGAEQSIFQDSILGVAGDTLWVALTRVPVNSVVTRLEGGGGKSGGRIYYRPILRA